MTDVDTRMLKGEVIHYSCPLQAPAIQKQFAEYVRSNIWITLMLSGLK
jgi:hypothetical protein